MAALFSARRQVHARDTVSLAKMFRSQKCFAFWHFWRLTSFSQKLLRVRWTTNSILSYLYTRPISIGNQPFQCVYTPWSYMCRGAWRTRGHNTYPLLNRRNSITTISTNLPVPATAVERMRKKIRELFSRKRTLPARSQHSLKIFARRTHEWYVDIVTRRRPLLNRSRKRRNFARNFA